MKQLVNPPITEALIDIRVKPLDDDSLGLLAALPAKLAEFYPTHEMNQRREFKLDFGQVSSEPNVPTTLSSIEGYRFSGDHNRVLQLRRDGFTLSFLKPYSSWLELVSEAKKLYKHYCEVGKPELVTRVAVRYINHLNIPLPIGDLADYLVIPPVTPQSLPQKLISFISQQVVEISNIDGVARITQGLEGLTNPEYAPILFDIDVVSSAQLSPDSEEIWNTLEKMHTMKNELFFTGVTQKTLELYQ